ncbi:uncharacterized protein BO97DRAFT_458743 [Aspergillus homomorphus CBS 101889]|uniref:Uncharacterized protein n=1 Tax=Aspergillus homomorphus (strain CBS 101889) TaxID=1450537 RepID=A0A395I6V9_ASPHC|nr:hypothetical protein BO97DRAFT_458743 [Aspergillus homomorphus CBS 101889]RAL15807.1 hypothetical protein BO97DRAFT_458743 [Aspergillus homomorphus CBS 101889]
MNSSFMAALVDEVSGRMKIRAAHLDSVIKIVLLDAREATTLAHVERALLREFNQGLYGYFLLSQSQLQFRAPRAFKATASITLVPWDQIDVTAKLSEQVMMDMVELDKLPNSKPPRITRGWQLSAEDLVRQYRDQAGGRMEDEEEGGEEEEEEDDKGVVGCLKKSLVGFLEYLVGVVPLKDTFILSFAGALFLVWAFVTRRR